MSPPPNPASPAATPPRPAPVRWLERAELATGALLLLMILALMLVQAFQRHLPVADWVWTGELARLGLVWLAFSLVGYLAGRDEHVTLKLFDMFAGPRLMRVVWVGSNLVVAAIGAALTVEGAAMVFGSSPQATPALGIPVTWVHAIPMLGMALAVARSVANTFLSAPPAPTSDSDPLSEEATR
ncbi:TRAP transporter small permease [Nocardiopsis sp. HNM0947]|uniref:TRAP transporter small permease n=1 Tax=Nocardiopsis coralli TaxID=2772213 RepID=A0ABR9P7B9_9ACTN|nr:TRAP transporter small permease [Nocardiopsis coralli]MBE2999743.1 TRAP transporter small permease [Nocardiopsis coralli]